MSRPPPSENLEEGVIGADGDAEAGEGGQDDGDHGLQPHLLGWFVWLVGSHFTQHLHRRVDSTYVVVEIEMEG